LRWAKAQLQNKRNKNKKRLGLNHAGIRVNLTGKNKVGLVAFLL
jgi:hypothetical protein